MRTMFIRLGVALAVVVAASVVATSARGGKDPFGSLTVAEVAGRVGKPGVHVFDNNGKDRWQRSHVPTAAWVDYSALKASDLPSDKSATLIFYCANEH